MLKVAILFLVASSVFAAPIDREMKRERPTRKGNERSERVTDVRVLDPIYNGRGCQPGTARVVLAPDNMSFSILFDNFKVEAMPNRGRETDQMACNVILPMQVPRDMQVSITRVDFRGFVGLTDAARGQFTGKISYFKKVRGSDAFEREGEPIRLNHRFSGPFLDNYEISTGAMGENGDFGPDQFSDCGGKIRIRIHNELQVMAKGGNQASISLDSIDGGANATYQINWRRCSPDIMFRR